ncbi:MAG: HAD hydrolase-like protein [Faecalibacterium sp.]|nr:HAD hydrolase-like protein [Faecalibacterium sp.]
MTLQAFAKQKDYLICVDSDGCAMDTMDIKHFRCFGPCMVEEWGLEEWAEPILNRWNTINLYSGTRGINRFKGLAMALTEIDKVYRPIEGVAELTAWAEHAPELSNQAIAEAAKTAKGPALAKALAWSKKVNAAIDALPESDKKPFPGVAEALAAAHKRADVAIVSSANREAVEEEWTRCGLLPSVDVLCCQDSGSKAACIAQLKAKGYNPAHILMVGDAPGDQAAAGKNGVLFYPILARHEADSWAEFTAKALPALLSGSYGPYGQEMAKRFEKNLL